MHAGCRKHPHRQQNENGPTQPMPVFTAPHMDTHVARAHPCAASGGECARDATLTPGRDSGIAVKQVTSRESTSIEQVAGNSGSGEPERTVFVPSPSSRITSRILPNSAS